MIDHSPFALGRAGYFLIQATVFTQPLSHGAVKKIQFALEVDLNE